MKYFTVILAEFLVLGLFFIPVPPQALETPVSQEEPTPVSSQPSSTSEAIRLLVYGEVYELELEDYVAGVVAAEMPAAFPDEALKAQAVAARTYAIYQSLKGKHTDQGADICGDSTCCQAWKSPEELAEHWGEERDQWQEKVERAVTETEGEVLFYGEDVAAAVYHASSIGQTNSAVEVWGNDVPYLISVETNSEKEAKGHGVGMSQYGAKDLAENGKTYLEILEHYYPGCNVKKAPGWVLPLAK